MSFVLLQKNGDAVTKKTKDMTFENLYKKCGFRSDTDFERKHIWSVKTKDDIYLVAVYGKTKGRAGQENKSELPPPVDTMLFYGAIGLVRITQQGDIGDLTVEEWNKLYEALYGGFEDLGSEDSVEEVDSVDDETKYDKSELTKSGYLKDDFVVSDSDSIEKTTKSQNTKKASKSSKASKSTKPSKTTASKQNENTVEEPAMKSNTKEDDENEDDDDDVNEEEGEDDEEDDDDDDGENEDEEEECEVYTSTCKDDSDEEVVFEDEYADSELSEEEYTDDEDEDEDD